jgi:phenylalanyl-tRNA synthetase beta chain
MRVSLAWLQTFVDIANMSPEELAEGLTCAGLEVDEIETIGPAFTHVIVGKITAIAPHPQADKLRLVTVNTGEESHTLVCGAPNVREGLLIPLAKAGARVYSPKQQTWFTLGQAVIRGVPSAGMICSLDELMLLDQFDKPEDGIWPLNHLLADDHIGQSLIQALQLTRDTVLHIAPTANRGDAMSMVGIAREVAAIFNRPLTLPSLPDYALAGSVSDFQVQLTHPEACTGYTAVLLDNVTVGPSPAWLVQRLAASGVRSINTVVDVTNLVLLELGQPLHAFDRDAMTQMTHLPYVLDVQHALNGSLTTLDGVNRTLSPDVPVVTLNSQPVAVAGIMGGAATAVTNNTTRVLLESAHFPITSTRKGSQALGLRTDASARYERGVDPTLYKKAVGRAVELLQTLTGANPTGAVSHSNLSHLKATTITLRYSRLNALYGIHVPADRVIQILQALGFTVVDKADDHLTVTVPSTRLDDVSREIDVIEEVVRIAGLEDVPAQLPVSSLQAVFKPDVLSATVSALQQAWVATGFQEVMTPSLVNHTAGVGVLNSHSSDHTHLRQALWPSVLSVAKTNLAKGQHALQLVEIGRVYNRQKAKPNARFTAVQEAYRCVALVTGQMDSWLTGTSQAADATGFFTLKGATQVVFERLGLAVDVQPLTAADAHWHPGRVGMVMVDGKAVGVIGELHPERVLAEKLGQRLWIIDLDVSAISTMVKHVDVPVISAYPAVQRDVAMKVPAGVAHAQIMHAIRPKADAADVLQHVHLFDVYTSERLAPGERSMAYRLTFQSMDKTLTDDVVKQRLEQASQSLKQTLGIDCPTG